MSIYSKGVGHRSPRTEVSFSLISELQKKTVPVTQSCRILNVGRAGYPEARRKPIAENILDRKFDPVSPNVAYVSDIAYIRTGTGRLYLAIVLDFFSRKVVGGPMVPNMPAELGLPSATNGD